MGNAGLNSFFFLLDFCFVKAKEPSLAYLPLRGEQMDSWLFIMAFEQ